MSQYGRSAAALLTHPVVYTEISETLQVLWSLHENVKGWFRTILRVFCVTFLCCLHCYQRLYIGGALCASAVV